MCRSIAVSDLEKGKTGKKGGRTSGGDKKDLLVGKRQRLPEEVVKRVVIIGRSVEGGFLARTIKWGGRNTFEPGQH